MKQVAHFSIISFDEFKEIFENKTTFNQSKTKWSETEILSLYKNITIPEQKGPYYVFKNLFHFTLPSKDYSIIPLGIKVEIIEESYILNVFKYTEANTRVKNIEISAFSIVPFFTSDYEGNLYLLMKNNTDYPISFETDEKFACGIFIPTGMTF